MVHYAAFHLPEWPVAGATLFRAVDPEITPSYINFRDPPVGGFSTEKRALGRGVIRTCNLDEEIPVMRKSRAFDAFGVQSTHVPRSPVRNLFSLR